MRNHLVEYQQAVQEAISVNHALGLPVYQSIDGYIVAIYPDGRIVKLEKDPSSEIESSVWIQPREN